MKSVFALLLPSPVRCSLALWCSQECLNRDQDQGCFDQDLVETMSTEAEWRQRPKRVLKFKGHYNLHELSNKNIPHHIVVCDRRFSSCREEVEKQKNMHWIHLKWSKYQPCSHKHSYLLNQLHYTPTIHFIRAHLTSTGHLLKYKHMNVASGLDVLCVRRVFCRPLL